MKPWAVWRWAATAVVASLLLMACTPAPGARQSAYDDLAAWWAAHALPGETVDMQEPEAWATVTGAVPISLPTGGDAAAVLDSLQQHVPDYCIALRSVAWDGVMASPWFRERYDQAAVAVAAEDPASPLTLFRYRPSPFDTGEEQQVAATLSDEIAGTLTVQSVRLSSRRLAAGEPVYATVTLAGDLRERLTVVWQLRDQASGRVWMRQVHDQPGGATTDNWPVDGSVADRIIVTAPDGLSPGDHRPAPPRRLDPVLPESGRRGRCSKCDHRERRGSPPARAAPGCCHP